MTTTPWWKTLPLPELGANTLPDEEWAMLSLVAQALEGGKPCVTLSMVGKPKTSWEVISKMLMDMGGRLIIERLARFGHGSKSLLAWEHGAVSINWTHDGPEWIELAVASTDKDFVEKVREIGKTELVTRDATGRVYTLIQNMDGPQLADIGLASVILEEGNYSDSVVHSYEHVVSDLASSNPCGRLIVINGPPGTGKTFFVRGLLSSVHNATFILIQAHLVQQIVDPNFVQVLLKTRAEDENKGPTILIIEDADSCLAPRQADNIDSISSLLNLCDGIIGSLLDVRVITTTNAATFEMDSAIFRPGRLCQRIDIGNLSSNKASAIYERITGHARELPPCSLADVYKLANGKEPERTPVVMKPQRRAAGF